MSAVLFIVWHPALLRRGRVTRKSHALGDRALAARDVCTNAQEERAQLSAPL